MPPMAFTPRKQTGFTLIELMITIFVMSILVGVAVPSFKNNIRDNSTTATANEFASAIALAKSEAVKRSRPVTVCPRASSGVACGTDWAEGWLVFFEEPNITKGAVPVVDAGNITVAAEPFKRSQIQQVNAANQWIRITQRGLLEAAVSFTVSPKASVCSVGALQKSISVGLGGRLSMKSEKVGSCS